MKLPVIIRPVKAAEVVKSPSRVPTDTVFVNDAGEPIDVGGGGFSGSYNDLTDKPQLFSGSYNDLKDKPTIPPAPTAASVDKAGVVKQADSVANVAAGSDAAALVTSFNTLLAKLRSSGALKA